MQSSSVLLVPLQGEVAMVDVAAEVWKAAPQKAAQAIDRLMALRLVSGTAIVNWVFDSHGVRQLNNELATGLAWEVFYNAVDKMLARAQVPIPPCTYMASSMIFDIKELRMQAFQGTVYQNRVVSL